MTSLDAHGAAVVERASATDLMELACDVGPVPLQVGALLKFAPGAELGLGELRAAMAERVGGIARLRQRLVRAPLGCGRPIWVDDPSFEIAHHVHEMSLTEQGDDSVLLEKAAQITALALPENRPLWSATLISGPGEGASALVVVFHHVLSDGMGGLSVLRRLADGGAVRETPGFPRRRPTWSALALDALRDRAAATCRVGLIGQELRAAWSELIGAGIPRAPRCSIIRPIGSRRRLEVARVNQALLRSAGHVQGGSGADVLIAAVGGALSEFLAGRGEAVSHFVVGLAISGRLTADASVLGNRVGMMLVNVPGAGTSLERRS